MTINLTSRQSVVTSVSDLTLVDTDVGATLERGVSLALDGRHETALVTDDTVEYDRWSCGQDVGMDRSRAAVVVLHH